VQSSSMKKPRVLILRGTPVAPDPRVEKIGHSLQRSGYTVRVLAWDMTGQYPVEDSLNGIPVFRCRVKANFGRGLVNLVHQLRWQGVLLVRLLQQRNAYDILHACDFDTVLPALLAARLLKKKVIYDIFDFYADMLRATPGKVKEIIRRVDLWAVNRVDAVILADDTRVRQIAGSNPKRCVVLYNCLDDVQKPAEEPEAAADVLRLSYVGNLQVERGLLELVQVIKNRPEFVLDLAGFGGDEQTVLAAAAGAGNINWHGRVSYERALELNHRAGALIATYDPAIPNHRFSSPNKLFEAMLLGKPILAARHTNMDEIVEREGCGLVVNYGDTADLEAALLRLHRDEALRSRLGDSARQAFERTYNWKEMERRLVRLYKEVQA
jgi:glycosyltransferase involved in cell wall biosynthesis